MAKRNAERFTGADIEMATQTAQRKSTASSGDGWLVSCAPQLARNSSDGSARLGRAWRYLLRGGDIRRGAPMEQRRRRSRSKARCRKGIVAASRRDRYRTPERDRRSEWRSPGEPNCPD